MATNLAPGEISDLDPCKFMAVIGKQVIQPGSQVSTQALLRQAQTIGSAKMAWLMPRMAKAVPYLGYIVIAGTKPA